MWTTNTPSHDSTNTVRSLTAIILVGLAGLAWLALYVWSASPYARYLDHATLADLPLVRMGDYLALAVLFVAGWTLMTVAMMLPTSLPLITTFSGIVRRRPHPKRLVALLLAGYLAVWLAFGVVVHLGDWALHRVVAQNLWLALHPWVIAGGVLLLAGVYQFTPLKYYCLDKCRSPLTFIMGHWRGRNAPREAWVLGLRHGLFCLGCCWSLMLVMFAVGMGNLGWMLALGLVMAVEKNVPWGRRLGKPLGLVLVVGAVLMAITSLSGM